MARRPVGPDTGIHADTYPCRVYKRAQAHPVFATINRLRETYLSLGFDEAENPVIIDEKDIYRQFGPEAMAVLDRVFYLGGLPRPNVGIARDTRSRSRSIEILGEKHHMRHLQPEGETPRDAACLQEIRDRWRRTDVRACKSA